MYTNYVSIKLLKMMPEFGKRYYRCEYLHLLQQMQQSLKISAAKTSNISIRRWAWAIQLQTKTIYSLVENWDCYLFSSLHG